MDSKPEAGKKITLPSSGLAEDILAAFSGGADGVPGAVPVTEAAVEEETETSSPYASGDVWGEEEKKEEESFHLVGFFLGGEEYALEISRVQEIIRVGGWTRVPNSPGHIKGVINLRGRIIPVVDPKAVMDIKESGLTKGSRIMVIEAGGRVLGMLVDGVSQVMKLPSRVVEPPPDEVAEKDKGFIKGVGKMEGRLIILLDLDSVVGRQLAA
ncbi:MAG: chemotaxis protein CheW [Nitrospirae bacterium]|nr:chemotaxis protein CheW [Nitrospirota bacterium]